MAGEEVYRVAAEQLTDGFLTTEILDPGLWQAFLLARPWLPAARRQASDDALREALPEIVIRGLGDNHSLGDGDLGYIDLLLAAADALQDDSLIELSGQLASAVVEDIERNGARGAAPLGVESPGWTNGLAGIGYGLLRVAAPGTTASFAALLVGAGLRQE